MLSGEDGFQGVGHALVGGTQGRRGGRRAGDDLRVAGGGGHGQVSGGGLSGVIAEGESCAITVIIARRTGALKRESGHQQQRFQFVQEAGHIVQGLADVLRCSLVLVEVAVEGIGYLVPAVDITVAGFCP